MKRFLVGSSSEKDTGKRQNSNSISSSSSCSSDEIENTNDDNSNKNVNKKKRKNKFSPLWLMDDKFKNWLIEKPKGTLFCKICKQCLKAGGGKKDLVSHENSVKHQTSLKCIESQPTITNSFDNKKDKKTSLELKIAAFCVEHNLSFSISDHLVNLLRSVPSPEYAQTITSGRKKVTCITKNVLGQQQFENLVKLLQENKFSVCVDESTDLSTKKNLSVVVRLHKNFKVNDYFFTLIELPKSDAYSLYNALIGSFSENKIDYKRNLIGFAADGANVMCGKNHSLAVLLKNDCPHIFILKCICHSFSLCASYACNKLPDNIERLTREIFNYIQNSPKKIDLFNKIQILLELKPRKLLRPHQIRWLSLEEVVNRILELYEPLNIYFAFIVNVDKFVSETKILRLLEEPTTKLYFEFLKYILSYINNLNKLFQSEAPVIFRLHSEIKKILLTIIDNFMVREYIDSTPLSLIDVTDHSQYLDLSCIYLGGSVQYSLNVLREKETFNEYNVNEFKLNCRNFYVELVQQIFKRFDFDNEIFKAFEWLQPEVVINKKQPSIMNLCKHFPNLISSSDIIKIDEEWRHLRNFDFIKYNIDENTKVEEFWATVLRTKRNSDELAFPLLKNFVFDMLSLPNSSAVVERTFSQINLNKTKTRNRLGTDTLTAILLTKDYLKFENLQCFDVETNKELNSRMKSNNLYSKYV